MATVTTQTCDRCGEVVAQEDQFWEVGLVTACKPQRLNLPRRGMWQVKGEHKMEVCRPCMENMGLVLVKEPEPDSEPEAPPTLEELVREIAQHVCEEYMDGGSY